MRIQDDDGSALITLPELKSPESLENLNGLELLPGMPAEAFISTGSRHFNTVHVKALFKHSRPKLYRRLNSPELKIVSKNLNPIHRRLSGISY
jgi:hypothetical protein